MGSRALDVILAIQSGSQNPTDALFARWATEHVPMYYVVLSFSVAGAIYWLVAFRSLSVAPNDRRHAFVLRISNILFVCLLFYYIAPVLFFSSYKLIHGEPWSW
jgi:hypothetical protein